MANHRSIMSRVYIALSASVIVMGVYSFQWVYAKSNSELLQQCKAEANERDPTGSLIETCTEGSIKAGENLGTAYIVNGSKGIPESDGLDTDEANAFVSGAVLVKNGSTSKFWGTHAKILNKATTSGTSNTSPSHVKSEWVDGDFKFIGSSRSFYRGQGRGESHTWSTENTDTSKMLSVRILNSFFDHAIYEGEGTYKKTVYVYRCYGDKKDDSSTSSCFSKAPTYVVAHKIARIANDASSFTYNGKQYSNDETIEVEAGTTQIELTATHILKRADGWIKTDDATTHYGIDSQTLGTAITLSKNGQGTSSQTITKTYSVTGISTNSKTL